MQDDNVPYSLLRHGAHAFPLLLVKETGAMPPKDCGVWMGMGTY